MKYNIFVDGESGTTGLEIRQRLAKRNDIELMSIDPQLHRDKAERKKFLNAANLVFLCLPDEAARESVSLIENENVKVIDASTAHRTAPGWVYGFPELDGEQRKKIKASKRVAVPGCHATGFNSIIHPLIAGGILPKDYPINATSVSGYSGGGKKLIGQYEKTRVDDTVMLSPRYYALSLHHKHLPEMVAVNSLVFEPIFTPLISKYYRGMLVSVPFHTRLFNKKITVKEIRDFYDTFYKNEKFIEVMPFDDDNNLDSGYLDAVGCNGTNKLQLFVFGHDEEILVMSRLDNLGKGASGAAVQCMNIMLGLDESTGLY